MVEDHKAICQKVKSCFGGDFRKWALRNESITYDELLITLQRIYGPKLASDDQLVVKYKDEDGDMITVHDSTDLNYAVHVFQPEELKLYIYKDSDCDDSSCAERSPVTLDEFKAQMSLLRRTLDSIAKSFENVEVQTAGSDAAQDQAASNENHDEECNSLASEARQEFDPIYSASTKEERPKQQNGHARQESKSDTCVPPLPNAQSPSDETLRVSATSIASAPVVPDVIANERRYYVPPLPTPASNRPQQQPAAGPATSMANLPPTANYFQPPAMAHVMPTPPQLDRPPLDRPPLHPVLRPPSTVGLDSQEIRLNPYTRQPFGIPRRQ